MSADPNWIVGEDLVDFLSLGIDTGYFVLESLAYGADWERDIQGSADAPLRRLLEGLAEQFGLRAWENVEERLRNLDRRYGDVLVMADFSAEKSA
ncbi:MAG: hypothetical protein AAFP84_21240, partial [Actinomycetota bacterium]